MTEQANPYLLDTIAACLLQAYGLSGKIKRLPGENDNYLIEIVDGKRFILKLTSKEHPDKFLEIEERIAEHLHNSGVEINLARTIPTNAGDIKSSIDFQHGETFHVRLQTFIEGTPWVEAGVANKKQLKDLGIKLAQVDLAFTSLQDEGAQRTHRWDLRAASQHREKLGLLDDPQKRKMVESLFHLYGACALPELDSLPHSLIHGDANDENLLVEGGKIVGLLDFGDSLHNPTICELAIALAYAMLDQPQPLVAGAQVVAGYHGVRPLGTSELKVLYPLICGRLCTTVLIAAERRRIDPEHPTWFVTEERAWRLMQQLYPLDPLDAMEALCVGLDMEKRTEPGEMMEDLLQKRQRFVGPSLSLSYDEPILIERGQGQFLYDDRGKPYLDLVNNVCHVGHCHPKVIAAGQRQMAVLNTNTRYLYDALTEYAERLRATLPDPLEVCYFVNSGSEANELALRLAEAHTGRKDWLVIDGAYHGHTARLIALSPYKFMGKGGSGEPEPWVHVVPMPDGYRGVHHGKDRLTGEAYGDDVGKVIATCDAPIAGFLAESMMGCAGQIIPPEGYFERAFEHVRAAGGVCILDEVQVGFGRVGTHFWAFERYGVVPDIVVLGKPMGNGHPMGAVITTRAIAESFANGMEFFSTFGGNPVSCAIGMAVLQVIEEEALQQRAFELGATFKAGLGRLKEEYGLIGDVRGAGLFLGIELVRDRDTLEPAASEAKILIERMKARGVLLSTDGPLQNVIKIKPPMVLSQEDIDMTLRVLEDEISILATKK